MVNTYFEDIDLYLTSELMKANVCIKAAVAWCTDKKIIRVLSVALDRGVEIILIVNDDKINRNVDYSPITSKGGKVLFSSGASDIMHQKFCIIDDRVVVHGTYNWTNNAKQNDESITIVSDDGAETEKFTAEFDRLLFSIEERCRVVAETANEAKSKKKAAVKSAMFSFTGFEEKKKSSRVTRTFTMEPETETKLEQAARKYGVSKSAILERAFLDWYELVNGQEK